MDIDLSAAFDTIDHDILINHLEKLIGLLTLCSDNTKGESFTSGLEIMCQRNMTSALGLHKGADLVHSYSHFGHFGTSLENTMYVSVVMRMTRNCTSLLNQMMMQL